MKPLSFQIILWVLMAQLCHAQSNNPPISIADVEQVFGKGFKADPVYKIGDVESYRFVGKDYTVQVSLSPSYGLKFDDYVKNNSPKTVTWKAIPADPDGAKIEVREDGKDDLASTPAIAYIRKDKYVRLQILGNYYNYDNSKMPEARENMRKKLAQLKRIP